MTSVVPSDRGRRAVVLAGLAVVGVAAGGMGCGASSAPFHEPVDGGGGPDAGQDAVGPDFDGGGSDAAVGDGGGGHGGSFVSGAGGFAHTDAGADAPGEVGTSACFVQIKPVFPPSLLELPFGPNAKVRVHGIISGARPPVPAWRWTVNLLANNQAVKVTPDPQDPSTIEFPMQSPGRYEIGVSVSDDPLCKGQETATAAQVPNAWYWVRTTPPSAQVDVPPYEEAVRLQAGQALPQHTITLVGGQPVTLDFYATDPRTALRQAVTSYVVISSTTHTWSREGDTRVAAFSTSLLTYDSGSVAPIYYDVLVIPLPPATPLFAPLLFSTRTADSLAALPLQIDPGVTVAGSLAVASSPVKGGTVTLRAGALPSTVGVSDAAGVFGLRARPGRFSAIILSPDGAPLPQARVAASATSGIDLPSAGAATLSFTWRGDLTTTSLTAGFTTSAGPAAAGVDVRLESEPGALPDVGTVQVVGGGAGPQTLVATGVVRRTTTTDAAGLAWFGDVPRGLYRLIAVPPTSSTDGLTAIALDLTAAAPAATPTTWTLAPRVTVSGRLLGAPAGTRVLVLDDDPLPGRMVPPATLSADGSYALALDAAHAYHLLTDPPSGQKISRVALGPVETGDTPLALGDRTLPGMLSIAGQVVGTDGFPVRGALLQVYCMGGGPDCIDNGQLGAGEPLPLFETTTDANGGYALFVPDPAAP